MDDLVRLARNMRFPVRYFDTEIQDTLIHEAHQKSNKLERLSLKDKLTFLQEYGYSIPALESIITNFEEEE